MRRFASYKLVVIVLLLGMALVACTGGTANPTDAPEPAATEAPAEEEAMEVPTPEEAMEEEATPEEAMEEEPTPEEAIEEPTPEEAMEEESMGDFDGLTLAAEDCEYGGKIESITAVDEHTVEFKLCKTDPAFESKLAFIPFGIQSMEWLQETGGTGELLRKAVGTGPYMLENWVEGDQIIYKRFEDYWGDAAPAETAVLRWNQECAARFVELQAGNVQYITSPCPDDIETIQNDPNLTFLPSASPNILYLAMTNTFAPFDDVRVRQAVAMGIDRQRIVDNFWPEGSTIAPYFTPCSIPNGCEGDEWYDFDPEAARALLAEAGYPDGFETSIYYRDVVRQYLPEPNIVVVEFQDQLRENLGIEAEVVVMESGEFIAESQDGNLDGFHLLGWSADYPHVTNFLDAHFACSNTQFGTIDPAICEPLLEASSIIDLDEAAPLYADANNALRELVPMVPIAHAAASDAALASLEGAYTPPFGQTQFYRLNPGTDTLVFMQNNEPISVFCHDETDGESLRPCSQVLEPLFDYALDSGSVVPELALGCESSEDGKTFTCELRQGVLFHDGTTFDANDVVFSWAVGLDAENELHIGNTGSFFYYEYLWDKLLNAPETEE